jgi:hypothetical protein
MTIHELLWEMTKKNNFHVKPTKHVWIDGEPMLPSILRIGALEEQEAYIYRDVLGAKLRNLSATGGATGVNHELTFFIDYPENKPYLIILLDMTSRIRDIHGKNAPITRALTAIDNYESNPNR